jgi:hypothetical protein
MWQGAAASEDKYYTMQYYARKESADFNAGRVYMKIEFWDSNPANIYYDLLDITDQLTTEWQLFTHSATSAPGTVSVRGSFGYDWGSNPVSRIFFDGVRMAESPPPMQVWIGTTNYPATSGAWTNAVYSVTEADLLAVSAGNPLRIVIRAYDAYSGLQRSVSVGAEGPSTVLSVENVITNDLTLYKPPRVPAIRR